MSEMDIETVALLIYQAIFSDEESVEIENKNYPIEKTRATKIRFVKLGGYTFMEQNPFDITLWGKEIVEGHLIIWVTRGKDYIAMVKDGGFKLIQKSSE